MTVLPRARAWLVRVEERGSGPPVTLSCESRNQARYFAAVLRARPAFFPAVRLRGIALDFAQRHGAPARPPSKRPP